MLIKDLISKLNSGKHYDVEDFTYFRTPEDMENGMVSYSNIYKPTSVHKFSIEEFEMQCRRNNI